MPRLSPGALPKYRKHKATGNAIVTLNGRDHYLGPHGTKASRLEYDRLIREHVACGGASPDKRDELTIVELLAAFLAHAKDYYSAESTEVNNYKTLVKRLRTAYGQTLVRDFGLLKLTAFRQTLIDVRLSRTMINHSINRVRRIVKWGVANELVRPECLSAGHHTSKAARRFRQRWRTASAKAPICWIRSRRVRLHVPLTLTLAISRRAQVGDRVTALVSGQPPTDR